MSYKNWLKKLEPGAEVAINQSRYGRHCYKFSTVARITKSGQIVLTTGEKFTPRGDCIGQAGSLFVDDLVEPQKAISRTILPANRPNQVINNHE